MAKTFPAPETAIAFSVTGTDKPLPTSNPQLVAMMEDVCARLLEEPGDSLEPAWLSIARAAVLESFKLGMPELSRIAGAAGMTEDELRKQLNRRGLSFRSFVDNLRHGLAMGYVRDPTLTLVDIAFLLGFSEQSAFQRAFKRWTGKTTGRPSDTR